MYKCMSDTNTSCTNVCQIQILHVQMYVRYKYFMYKCMSDTNTSCTNVCQIQILCVQMYFKYKYFEKYFSNTLKSI